MQNFFSKYIGIVLFVATLMGSFHHHHDGKQHNDCKVCTVQSTIVDADTPLKSVYLSYLENCSEVIVTSLFPLHNAGYISNVNPRAPPQLS